MAFPRKSSKPTVRVVLRNESMHDKPVCSWQIRHEEIVRKPGGKWRYRLTCGCCRSTLLEMALAAAAHVNLAHMLDVVWTGHLCRKPERNIVKS